MAEFCTLLPSNYHQRRVWLDLNQCSQRTNSEINIFFTFLVGPLLPLQVDAGHFLNICNPQYEEGKNVRDGKMYIKDIDHTIRISQPCHIKMNSQIELGIEAQGISYVNFVSTVS